MLYKTLLGRTVFILLLIVLVIGILYLGKPVFMPLAIAGILALVFMPLCRWFERKGMNRVVATIFCGFLFSAVMSGILILLIWNIKRIGGDLTAVKENYSRFLFRFRHYMHDGLGIEPPKQKDLMAATVQPDAAGVGHVVAIIMQRLIDLIVNMLLILVYMVMLLNLRPRVKEFILKIAPPDTQSKTKMIIIRSVRVVQQYLSGLAIVIGCLWVMYGVGFSILGVRNAIFFAILCGLLEIVPFVGNLTGSTLTSLMALSQGGGMQMVAGVLAIYAVIQFLQFYIISPLVMRTQVRITPLFTVVILIAGDLIWGIPGMILAIPALGIIKIIFDNIEILQPWGYLIGQEKVPAHSGWLSKRAWFGRLKRWFANE
jgi:predicted PurR-regulated permease PerM